MRFNMGPVVDEKPSVGLAFTSQAALSAGGKRRTNGMRDGERVPLPPRGGAKAKRLCIINKISKFWLRAKAIKSFRIM